VIVLDASVLVDVLVGASPAAIAVRERVAAESSSLAAPHLVDAEVVQVLRRFVRGGELEPARALGAIQDLLDLRLMRYAHAPLLVRAFALRDNVTVYDALYLALAEALDAPLLTLDRALAGVPGSHATVEVLGSAA
jgi:predicted nucleic acid-binding protein